MTPDSFSKTTSQQRGKSNERQMSSRRKLHRLTEAIFWARFMNFKGQLFAVLKDFNEKATFAPDSPSASFIVRLPIFNGLSFLS